MEPSFIFQRTVRTVSNHPIGLLSTADALYISDFGAGKVYQITSSVPEPESWAPLSMGLIALLSVGAAKRKSGLAFL